jgi:allantoicase
MCSIEGADAEILPRTKLLPDTRHVFIDELQAVGPLREVRLNVFPDGGVARLRIYGTATENARWDAVARRINTRIRPQAEAELRPCCGSSEWVRQMIASRPFGGGSELLSAAESIWWELDPPDWQEAFQSHPRIGDKATSIWSRQEQSSAAAASSQTTDALAEVNRDYEKRFGHIFIVCATGKGAGEILAIAQRRLQNAPDEERRVAAEEQLKITKLRLMKLVS